MDCIKCGALLPDGAVYCPYCGRKQIRERHTRTRANGQGTVYKRPNGRYIATISRYYVDADGAKHKQTRNKICSTKKEAYAALNELQFNTTERKKEITFASLYEQWFPTHKAGTSTMGCYSAAYKYFAPLYGMDFAEIDIDDLQDCVDECEKGKRTRQNMKALCGLMYKYAIPRHLCPDLNLAQYIKITGDSSSYREPFSAKQIDAIKKQIGKTPYADYTYCLIYTGFRVSELLGLKIEDYDSKEQTLTGGGKTAAGTDRIVTLSPKIQPIIKSIIGGRKTGYIFSDRDGKRISKDYFADLFYRVLDAARIDNPVTEDSAGQLRHKYSPHTCRHTFIDLMKYIEAPPKVALSLEGHSSEDMRQRYEGVSLDDRRRITDRI